jgi:hypothetical protein
MNFPEIRSMGEVGADNDRIAQWSDEQNLILMKSYLVRLFLKQMRSPGEHKKIKLD